MPQALVVPWAMGYLPHPPIEIARQGRQPCKPEVGRPIERLHRVDFHLEGQKAGSVKLETSEYSHFTAKADGCGLGNGVIASRQWKNGPWRGMRGDPTGRRKLLAGWLLVLLILVLVAIALRDVL
jgi:hypothetical protein